MKNIKLKSHEAKTNMQSSTNQHQRLPVLADSTFLRQKETGENEKNTSGHQSHPLLTYEENVSLQAKIAKKSFPRRNFLSMQN